MSNDELLSVDTAHEFICATQDKGGRKYQEDSMFIARYGPNITMYAVLDGHNGDGAALYFSRILPGRIQSALKNCKDLEDESEVRKYLTKMILEEDEEWYSVHFQEQFAGDMSGCTFSGCLETQGSLYTVNIGDSAVIINHKDHITRTENHSWGDYEEDNRAIQAGFELDGNKVISMPNPKKMVQTLNLSRAMGDTKFKRKKINSKYAGIESPVSPVPTVVKYKKHGDEKIVIGSDGLMDNISRAEFTTSFINKGCKNMTKVSKMRYSDPKNVDNITVMIIDLSKVKYL